MIKEKPVNLEFYIQQTYLSRDSYLTKMKYQKLDFSSCLSHQKHWIKYDSKIEYMAQWASSHFIPGKEGSWSLGDGKQMKWASDCLSLLSGEGLQGYAQARVSQEEPVPTRRWEDRAHVAVRVKNHNNI